MWQNIIGSLVANVIWAPALLVIVREWRKHRQALLEVQLRTHALLVALHARLDAGEEPEVVPGLEDFQ